MISEAGISFSWIFRIYHVRLLDFRAVSSRFPQHSTSKGHRRRSARRHRGSHGRVRAAEGSRHHLQATLHLTEGSFSHPLWVALSWQGYHCGFNISKTFFGGGSCDLSKEKNIKYMISYRTCTSGNLHHIFSLGGSVGVISSHKWHAC